MRRNRAQDGQAAAELVAVAPILLCVVLAVAQLAVAGYALWSAGDARSALPAWLEDGAEVETAGPVAVTVQAPALLPGVPDIAVDAAAALDVGQAADG